MRFITLILILFISTWAFAQTPTPTPLPEQTDNPRTLESYGNFIAYTETTGFTGNSYVTIYNLLSADRCKDKLLILQNIDLANDLDYSIKVRGLNIGANNVPLTIGETEYTDVTLGEGEVAAVAFTDPVSVMIVQAKSTVPDTPAEFVVQASCFKQ